MRNPREVRGAFDRVRVGLDKSEALAEGRSFLESYEQVREWGLGARQKEMFKRYFGAAWLQMRITRELPRNMSNWDQKARAIGEKAAQELEAQADRLAVDERAEIQRQLIRKYHLSPITSQMFEGTLREQADEEMRKRGNPNVIRNGARVIAREYYDLRGIEDIKEKNKKINDLIQETQFR